MDRQSPAPNRIRPADASETGGANERDTPMSKRPAVWKAGKDPLASNDRPAESRGDNRDEGRDEGLEPQAKRAQTDRKDIDADIVIAEATSNQSSIRPSAA